MAMAEKKAFLLRVDAVVLDAVQKWAADDLRSANAQVEYLLRRVLREAGRLDVSGGSRAADSGRMQDRESVP